MADAYASFEVTFEADLSRIQAGMAQGLSWGRVYGEGMASSFAEGFSSVSGALNLLQGIKGQFADVGQGLSEIFGMKAGAEMAYFRRQLTGMTGDAQKAQSMLDGLVNIANTTAFDNNDIFQLATNALGSGTKAEDLLPQVSNIGDAASAIGIRDMAVFRRFSRNLFDIRGKEGEANQRDVGELIRQAPQFAFQAARVLGTDVQGARDQINSMSGQDLFNLVETIGKNNRGAAAAAGLSDPFVAAANAVGQLNAAMAPTGELLNRVVTPLLGLGIKAVELFGRFNSLAGGVPGLVLGLGLLRAAINLHSATMARANLALNGLAASAGRASLAMGAGGVASSAGGKGIGKLLSVPDLIIAAAAAGFQGASWADKNANTNPMAKMASYAPLLFGGGGALYQVFKSVDMLSGGKVAGALGIESAAKDLKEAAQGLKEASAMGYGFGKRGRHVMSSVEAGYALLGAERLGVA